MNHDQFPETSEPPLAPPLIIMVYSARAKYVWLAMLIIVYYIIISILTVDSSSTSFTCGRRALFISARGAASASNLTITVEPLNADSLKYGHLD